MMDFTSKGIAWIAKIGEKLENLCSEVDAKSQEQLDYVENQVQIAGANMKQFFSEFIQDILPESLSDTKEEESSSLSSEQNRKRNLPASELSNFSVAEDNEEQLSHSNLFSLVFPVESADGVHVDSSFQPREDMVRKMSVEDNLEKTLSSGKSSVVVASAEATSNMTSLPSEGDIGVEGTESLPIASVECQEFDPSMQVEKAMDGAALEAGTLNVPLLTSSTYSTESQDSEYPHFDEINSSAGLPAGSDGVFADQHINEPEIDSALEVDFDGNCVLVNMDDLSSGSNEKSMLKLKVKPRKQGKKDTPISEEQTTAGCKTQSSPDEKLESTQEVFCESDWEII